MLEVIIPFAELDDDAWQLLKQAAGSFRAALRAGEHPAIDDYLPAAGHLRQTILLELVHEEIEFLLKAGRPAQVDDYLIRYPELAADPESLGELREAESTLRARAPARAVGGCEVPSLPAQTRLGRFELRELVGKGSFGVVYKAWDSELDRLVALKVARGDWTASDASSRSFFREAKSAARLRHPHIVAVHDAGQIDGTCYLVAEFVSGTTLEERLKQAPIDLRRASQIAALVAEALDYAHGQGVVHRDLKPANILLDQDEHPIVADFGLAKNSRSGFSSSGDGRLIGTPAYMSPEQARGDAGRVDGRSDIYSLGVVLYQMVTGRVPFGGFDRMVLHQLLHDDPQPPRALNDRVPRDLETICLTAMAKEPHQRYATAGKLAEDLRLFLDGEPIKARRTCALKREFMRLRRRPVVAALGAAVILITLAGFIGVTCQWQRAQTYRRRAETSLAQARLQFEEAERERQRVSAHLEQANQTIHGLVSRLGEIQAKQASDPALTRTMLMDQVLDDGWAFLRQLRGDPAFCSESARTSVRLAGLTSQTYDSERIVAAWSHALPYCQQLVRIEPDSGDALEMVAQCELTQAGWLEGLCCFGDAKSHFRRAIEPLRRARDLFLARVRQSPGNVAIQSRLAGCEMQLATSSSKMGDATGALELMRHARRMLEGSLRERPGDSYGRARLVAFSRIISVLHSDHGQHWLALSQARRALRLAEELVDDEPSSRDAQIEAAYCLEWLSRLLGSEGESTEALVYSQRAIELCTAFARDTPHAKDHQLSASALLTHGKNSRLAGDLERAVSCCRASLEICTQLLRDHPKDWWLQLWRAQVAQELAVADRELGLSSEQHALVLEAIESVPAASMVSANDEITLIVRARQEFNLGEVSGELDRLEDALAHYRSSVGNWKALAQRRPLDRDELAIAGASRYRLSWTLDALGRPKPALRSYWETVAFCEQCLRDFPGDPKLRLGLRTCLHQIGTIFNETDRPALALGPYRRAIEIGESMPTHQSYSERTRLMDCAGTWYRLGEALERLGRLEEAAEAYRNHIVRYRQVVAETPRDKKPKAQLRDRLGDATRVLLRLGRWTEAAEAARERRALCPEDPAVALSAAVQLATALLPLSPGDSAPAALLNQERRRCAIDAIAAVRHAAQLISRTASLAQHNPQASQAMHGVRTAKMLPGHSQREIMHH